MKTLNLTLDTSKKKLYLKIADALKEAIKQNHVVALEKLPSTRVLAEQLNVNRHTVMSSYSELVSQGWIENKERQGYFVAQYLPVTSSRSAGRHHKKVVKKLKWRIVKENTRLASKPASQYPLNFAGGNPDISLFPFYEFKGYMADALSRPNISELNYGDNAGFKGFIEEVGTYLRRVRSIQDRELIVVNGTQEALYILAQVLLKAGDKVAVESLGYRPAWNAFENAGAELIGVNQTEQGIDVGHLESLIIQHKIRLLYLTPLHQYPTTTTLPIKQRVKIYQLAQQHNIPIIEDDYDHEYHYQSQPLAPMAATDPSGLVIYLSSFSKIMFPGIRLGVIAVDKALAQHIINYRTMLNHKANVVVQDAVSRWMRDGAFERHLRKTTRIYQKRRELMVQLLGKYQNLGIKLTFSVPPGGMALWVNVGKNALQISQEASKQGIYLLAENSFHLDNKNNKDQFIRLGFAGLNEEKIHKGLAKLMLIIQSYNE